MRIEGNIFNITNEVRRSIRNIIFYGVTCGVVLKVLHKGLIFSVVDQIIDRDNSKKLSISVKLITGSALFALLKRV